MSAHEESTEPWVARQRAYALLGAMLLEGLDASRLALVRALPGLAEELTAFTDHDGLEALAAEHQSLFGHEVFPFAGVFMGAEGLVGEGAPASVLRAAHEVLGIACPDEPGPDHLGQALRLLGTLVDAELEARAHRDAHDVRTLVHWQRRVLDEALLPWMPPLWAAIGGQPASVWTRAVELAVGVLARHGSELGGSLPLASGPQLGVAPEVEAMLDDPSTGLGAVARALVTPSRSGVYLARRDLGVLARRSGVPQGLGSRQSMLERLLWVAAEHRELPHLLDELRQLLQARDDAYAGLAAEPGLAPHVSAWRRRLAGSLRLVERLYQAAPRPNDLE